MSIDIQTSEELMQMDTIKMMTYEFFEIFTINDAKTHTVRIR